MKASLGSVISLNSVKHCNIASCPVHKLPEKSKLNVRSVCPVSPLWLVCPVSPMYPGCPVCSDDHDNLWHDYYDDPDYDDNDVRGDHHYHEHSGDPDYQGNHVNHNDHDDLTILTMMTIVFVRKLEVVWPHITSNLVIWTKSKRRATFFRETFPYW